MVKDADAQLWETPPWAKLKPAGGYQMGLAPAPLDQWLPLVATRSETERKLGLLQLQRLPEPVYQSLPGAQDAEHIASEFVMAHLGQTRSGLRQPQSLHSSLSPLVQSALRVPDDLCLLELNAQTKQFCLVAASLCSPSYWALSEKLGQPLSAIHAPVPGLNSQLGERIDRFFLQLPVKRCFVRRNFFVHAQQELYQPQPDVTDYGQVSPLDLLLRCERQSILRINQQLALFSIRVELTPLAYALQWPSQAQGLRQILLCLTDAQRAAFGSPEKLQMVLGYLANPTIWA